MQKWRAIRICTHIQCRKEIVVRVRVDLTTAVQKMLQQKGVSHPITHMLLDYFTISVLNKMLGPTAYAGRQKIARAVALRPAWVLQAHHPAC